MILLDYILIGVAISAITAYVTIALTTKE